MALNPGDIVGGYEVIGPLGTGGMATVYQARHTVLGSDHALKVLRQDLVAQVALRNRFLDEGRVQAQLRHPGIVRVTGIVSEPGVAGLVMDLLAGRSLEDELHEVGPLSIDVAAGWMLQVLDAVGFAHARGVVHRDLKPSNLFLVDDEELRTVRVLDFGIAKVAGRGQTRAGGTLGTYGFMAPEQLKDASDVDGRADVFALGAVFYELLCGQPAFAGETDFELMNNVSHAAFDVSKVPAPLRSIVSKALARDRTERFQGCAGFARALEPFARPEDVELVEAWDELERQAPAPAPPRVPVTLDVEAESVPASAPASAPLALVRPEPLPPAVPLVPPDATGLSERREILVRIAGSAQLLTGVLNTFLLWMLACYGYPMVFASLFAALGLPGFFQGLSYCGGTLGLGLLFIGPLEILAGLRAQMRGSEGRSTVRRTATLQIASLAFGGIPSFCVGVATIGLLLLYPDEGPVGKG